MPNKQEIRILLYDAQPSSHYLSKLKSDNPNLDLEIIDLNQAVEGVKASKRQKKQYIESTQNEEGSPLADKHAYEVLSVFEQTRRIKNGYYGLKVKFIQVPALLGKINSKTEAIENAVLESTIQKYKPNLVLSTTASNIDVSPSLEQSLDKLTKKYKIPIVQSSGNVPTHGGKYRNNFIPTNPAYINAESAISADVHLDAPSYEDRGIVSADESNYTKHRGTSFTAPIIAATLVSAYKNANTDVVSGANFQKLMTFSAAYLANLYTRSSNDKNKEDQSVLKSYEMDMVRVLKSYVQLSETPELFREHSKTLRQYDRSLINPNIALGDE